MKQRCFFCQI